MDIAIAQSSVIRTEPSRPVPNPTAPSSSVKLTLSPRQTEALLPTELKLSVAEAGGGNSQQDVEGQRQEQSSLADEIRKAAQKANRYFTKAGTHLQFIVGGQTGRTVIQVVDTESHEILREIPPEGLKRLVGRISQMRGLLFEAQG